MRLQGLLPLFLGDVSRVFGDLGRRRPEEGPTETAALILSAEIKYQIQRLPG